MHASAACIEMAVLGNVLNWRAAAMVVLTGFVTPAPGFGSGILPHPCRRIARKPAHIPTAAEAVTLLQRAGTQPGSSGAAASPGAPGSARSAQCHRRRRHAAAGSPAARPPVRLALHRLHR
jgi:hypothetical protein